MASQGEGGQGRAAARGAGEGALRFVMIALACYGAAWLGRWIPAFEGVPLIALQTGVALAALWRCGFPWWPGVFVGALAAMLVQGQPLPVALSLAIAGTAAPIAAVALGGRYGYQGGNSRRDLVVLAVAGAISACLSAALGVGTLAAAGRVAWVDAGLLDFVCPMDYSESDLHFRALVSNQLKLVGGRVPVYPGIGATASHMGLTPDRVVGQIHWARTLGANGFTVFNLQPDTAREILPGVALSAGRTPAKPPHNR